LAEACWRLYLGGAQQPDSHPDVHLDLPLGALIVRDGKLDRAVMGRVVRVLETDRAEVCTTHVPAIRDQPSVAFGIDNEPRYPVWDRAHESKFDGVLVSRAQLSSFT